MSRSRSNLVRRRIVLESLEERWTPAVGSMSPAGWLANLRTAAVVSSPASGATFSESVRPTINAPASVRGVFHRDAAPAPRAAFGLGAAAPGRLATVPNSFRPNILRQGLAPVQGGGGRAVTPTPVAPPANTTPTEAQNPVTTPTASPNAADATLPANVSGQLAAVYQHSLSSQVPLPSGVVVVGDKVSVAISGTADGDFDTLVSSLRNLGMDITSSNATYRAVRGMLPISQIPTAAAIPQLLSISAMMKPSLG